MLPAAVLYWPMLGFDYVWDDLSLFVDNPQLRTGAISWETLTQPILPGTAYIRPFALLSFMLEFRWLGTSAAISHSLSFALYLGNLTLVFALALMHFQRLNLRHASIRAAVAALVYAVHPALIESTAWISGRFDLLATFFVLLALVADLRISSAWLRAGVLALAFGMALGSKEVAAVLPALLLIQRLALQSVPGNLWLQVTTLLRQHWRTVLLCGMVGAVYLLVRLGAAPYWVGAGAFADTLPGVPSRIAYSLQTLWLYLSLAALPFGSITPIHPVDPAGILEPGAVLRATVAALLLCGLALAVVRRLYAGWMLLLALLCLLPVLNIVPLPLLDTIGCERFLTLPLAFLAIALASAPLSSTTSARRIGSGVAMLSLGLWSVAAAQEVHGTLPNWRDDLALWSWVYADPRNTEHARTNYTSAALRAERYDLARTAFEDQLRHEPLEATHQVNYGLALAMSGEPEEGRRYIQGAMSAYPRIPPPNPDDDAQVPAELAFFQVRIGAAHYALAEVALGQGQFDLALEESVEAVRFRPRSPRIALIKSLALSGLGRHAEAQASFDQMMSMAHPRRQREFLQRRERFLDELGLAPQIIQSQG